VAFAGKLGFDTLLERPGGGGFVMSRSIALVAGLLGAVGLMSGSARGDTNDTAARHEMVRIIEVQTMMLSAETGIAEIDPRVLDAMREVPRHAFVPEPLRAYAYGDHPLPVTPDQNIAAPLLIALMTHVVALEPDDVVYETGTGAGYHAAVISRLVREVYSVEVDDALADRAARLLKDLHYDNVFVRGDDGYYGWPAHAPYDAIIVKEAIDHVPPPLLSQLKRGGRMVIPLGPAGGPQYLTVITKGDDGRASQQRIMPVRFSPLQGGERT
jgi:protein-L-isoaspartate(D-aspartate) O-methyltransferase